MSTLHLRIPRVTRQGVGSRADKQLTFEYAHCIAPDDPPVPSSERKKMTYAPEILVLELGL